MAAAQNPTVRLTALIPMPVSLAVLKSDDATGGKALWRLWTCEELSCCLHLTQRAKGICPRSPQSPVGAERPWPTTSSRASLEAAPRRRRACLSILNAISPPSKCHFPCLGLSHCLLSGAAGNFSNVALIYGSS